MNITQLIAFAIVAAVIIVFLKQSHPEIAMALTAVAAAMLLIGTLLQVYGPIQQFAQILAACGLESSAVTYLLKTLGICYLTRFCCELCTDFGQSSLAAKIDLAGRAAVFLLSLPLLIQVLEVAISLM